VDGQWVNVEVLELLTEWLQEIREPNALQWLQAMKRVIALFNNGGIK
jgi:hypothetical protein